MSAYSLIKKLCFTGLVFTSFSLWAQQVKKIDCCKDINAKATIIINDNTVSVGAGTAASTANASFNFELTSSVNTSAGVYNSDGNLVRTLWGGVRYDAGCYLGQWDGLLDDGTQAPYGNYTVKVLTNNVQYTWEGGIGETSTQPFSDYKLRGQPQSLVVIGTTIYGAGGYSEHETSLKTFSTSDINLRTPPSGQTEMNGLKICTDGNIIYYGGDKTYDPNGYASWVHGIHVGDINLQNPVNFSAQASIVANSGSGGLTDNNAIALYNSTSRDYSGYIGDLTVQKTGSLLFVSRPGLNQLQVYNKTTGATIKNYTITGIGAISADQANFLFITVNNIVKKYLISADGNTFTDTGASFSGLTSANKITYSANLNQIAVFDDVTFQVKVFNVNGGVPVATIGQAGGYTSSPYFTSARFCAPNFLYFQDDNSLWLDQPAFNSLLHYNAADYTLKESSQNLPTSRACAADQNNPARVFSNYNEYRRDYTKPLDNGANGSWKFYANWNKGVNSSNDNYNGFTWVNTFSNGRTYGRIFTAANGNRLVELTDAGIRETGIYMGDNANIGRDGTWYEHGNNNSYGNQPTGIYKKTLTGFDSSNNPVWSSPVLFVADPSTDAYTPWNDYERTAGQTGDINSWVYFANGTGQNGTDPTRIGHHLGLVRTGTGKPIWQTSRSTFTDYIGPYPANGDWDVGNNIGYSNQHSETHAMVYDNDIFFNINGEFWQNTETNYWNQYNKATGLLIGNFGTDGNLAKLTTGQLQMAGNAISTAMVKVGNDYYIYHCDESVHPFVHSWHVTGLNTVNITTIQITLSHSITLPSDPSDMMAGIPYRSTGFYGGSGWIMNPTNYDNHTFGAQFGDTYPDWRVTTTKNSYRKDDNDIYFESDNNANGVYKTAIRTLGNNSTNNWNFSGSFKLYRNINDKTKYDLLDASGKILITFTTGQDNNIYINGTPYQPSVFDDRICSFKFTNFIVKNTNGQVTFAIDGYSPVTVNFPADTGANFKTPTSFRIRAGGSGDNNHTLVSIKSLYFYPN